MRKDKKIVFISSRQNELQHLRKQLRELINTKDHMLQKLFVAKSFEMDLAGRKESVSEIVKDWVLKSDVYLGIFDREYSEPTVEEYHLAINDRFVRKEIIIFVRDRKQVERQPLLNVFLTKIMDPHKGHSCIIYNNQVEFLEKAKSSLIVYYGRSIESFALLKETLGPKLDRARGTNFPESMRRKLLEPMLTYMIPLGRKGVPEYYKFDIHGDKIDVTWDTIIYEPNISQEIKDFYHHRYKKPFD